MYERGCVAVPREDGTFFTTIYNNEFPPSSPYAAIVVNSKTKEDCEITTNFLIAVLNASLVMRSI